MPPAGDDGRWHVGWISTMYKGQIAIWMAAGLGLDLTKRLSLLFRSSPTYTKAAGMFPGLLSRL
jgi:hypothetical protein